MKETKNTKKTVHELSKSDKELLELVKIAREVVLKEDKILLRELAKH